jgi:LysW-gamma-L-lysine carboxypeptidase
VADGWLHGRGTVDAKGPLAAFVDSAAAVPSRTGWQLVVIGAVEEERDSKGARFVAGQYRPDYAIIGEPNSWERIGFGYKGSAWASLTVRRGQVHTASGLETACESAVNAWDRVRAGVAVLNEGQQRLFDQVLLSLRGLQSGEDGFEQWARLQIMARLPPTLPPESWYARLAQLAGEEILVEAQGFAIPAYQCSKNTPLVRAFLSSIRAAGETPGFVLKTGTADLNIVGPAWEKHPNFGGALVYGPGDSSLDHTPGERIEIAEYHHAVAVLTGALSILMKGPQARP